MQREKLYPTDQNTDIISHHVSLRVSHDMLSQTNHDKVSLSNVSIEIHKWLHNEKAAFEETTSIVSEDCPGRGSFENRLVDSNLSISTRRRLWRTLYWARVAKQTSPIARWTGRTAAYSISGKHRPCGNEVRCEELEAGHDLAKGDVNIADDQLEYTNAAQDVGPKTAAIEGPYTSQLCSTLYLQ